MKQQNTPKTGAIGYIIIFVLAAVACALVAALLLNIFERKAEAKNPYVRVVEVTEDTTDPEVWGANWPKQYESYLLTAETTRTRFGGHRTRVRRVRLPPRHLHTRGFVGVAPDGDGRIAHERPVPGVLVVRPHERCRGRVRDVPAKGVV